MPIIGRTHFSRLKLTSIRSSEIKLTFGHRIWHISAMVIRTHSLSSRVQTSRRLADLRTSAYNRLNCTILTPIKMRRFFSMEQETLVETSPTFPGPSITNRTELDPLSIPSKREFVFLQGQEECAFVKMLRRFFDARMQQRFDLKAHKQKPPARLRKQRGSLNRRETPGRSKSIQRRGPAVAKVPMSTTRCTTRPEQSPCNDSRYTA